MADLYKQTLQTLGESFDVLYNQIGPPKLVRFGDKFAYRYEERTIHQAIIQKIARLVTGLQSVMLLNGCGLLQEQAVIQRTLDELQQDVFFLGSSVIFDELTELHVRYLGAFWEEEFDDPSTAISSSHKRPMIPRKKIIAYLTKDRGTGYDQSSTIECLRIIGKTYSGYVHGASPQLMELCHGEPPRFHIFGNINSPLFYDHEADLNNYFHRGILAFVISAKAFGNEKLFEELQRFSIAFEKRSAGEKGLR